VALEGAMGTGKNSHDTGPDGPELEGYLGRDFSNRMISLQAFEYFLLGFLQFRRAFIAIVYDDVIRNALLVEGASKHYLLMHGLRRKSPLRFSLLCSLLPSS
jgi:hypothetical protein